MTKFFALFAAFNGLAAVILGAFGAHGLRGKIPDALLNAYQTGVQYHFYHILALLFIVVLALLKPASRWSQLSGCFFIAGIILFSGSLYAIALGAPRWIGPVTPLGGLSFMAGWVMLFIHLIKTDFALID